MLPADAPDFILEHVPLLLSGPSPASSPYLALYTMAGWRAPSLGQQLIPDFFLR